MEYRALGKSGMEISRIGLGCMSLSATREQEGISIIHRAIDLGINFIDTADLYEKGMNETLVGKALQGKRNSLFLATKVGNQWRADGSGWDWNPRKAYIIASVEESLKRLATDYIDLYQLHGGTIDDPIDETIDAFETLQRVGKIRHYGISSIRPNVIREYVKRSRITSVMMQYSLLDRRPEESILSLLREHGIGVLVRGALAQGLLIGKPAKAYLGLSADSVEQVRSVIRRFVRSDRTATEVCLGFALDHPAVSSVIVGARTHTQLEDLVSFDWKNILTAGELYTISSCVAPLTYSDHR